MTRTLLLLSTVLLLTACPPSWEEIQQAGTQAVEAERKLAEERLAQLEAVGEKAGRQGFEALPAVDWGDRPAPDFSIPFPEKQTTNAALITLEQLQGKVKTPRVSFEFAKTKEITFIAGGDFEDARALLEGDVFEEVAGSDSLEEAGQRVREVLKRATDLRYVLVVRTHRLVYGDVTQLNAAAFGPDSSEESMGEFSSGLFVGDALLYGLSDGAFLGGVPVRATNSAQVEVRGSPGFLKEDLKSNIKKALREALPGTLW